MIERLRLPDVWLIQPKRYTDERGYLEVLWSEQALPDLGQFYQDNLSFSRRGVVRGLHFQSPVPQGKLVSCLTGCIWDVAVDVRPGSATFGEWVAAELDAEAGTQIWVPPGFAHGFCVLSEEALVLYKNTSVYDPNGQYSVRWDDPAIGIEWPDFGAAILSEKDAGAPLLAEIAPSVLAGFRV